MPTGRRRSIGATPSHPKAHQRDGIAPKSPAESRSRRANPHPLHHRHHANARSCPGGRRLDAPRLPHKPHPEKPPPLQRPTGTCSRPKDTPATPAPTKRLPANIPPHHLAAAERPCHPRCQAPLGNAVTKAPLRALSYHQEQEAAPGFSIPGHTTNTNAQAKLA